MKPKPASSMQRATPSGARSMRARSASRRSADPDELVAERLPCLATAQPAPAAISAAVVETLNVRRPPPVPAVSSRSSRPASTGAASSRMVRARPATSSTVSPFVRSPIRKPAISVSSTSPDMIRARTSAAWSADSDCPDAIASRAGVTTGSGIGEEVAQQHPARLGQYRFRMELHTLGRQLAVANAHDHASALRRALEAVGQLVIDDQRVVAAHGQRAFETGEDRPAVVLDVGALAVHGVVPDHAAAERGCQRLVAQAHAQRT